MAQKHLFRHKNQDTGEVVDIQVDDRKGIADAALEERERAIADETTPPAWSLSPGECTYVREIEVTKAPKSDAPKKRK